MRYKILNKLRKAGAVSQDNAVTIGDAELDYQEQMWLDYFAGAFLGKIKKTDDRRYYIQWWTEKTVFGFKKGNSCLNKKRDDGKLHVYNVT